MVGSSWETIKNIEGTGHSVELKTYRFIDSSPSSGQIYYRLKAIDFDNGFSYSPIVTTHCETVDYGFEIAPNPTHSDILITIEPSTIFLENEIWVTNALGQVIQHKIIGNVPNYTITLVDLPKGIYSIVLKNRKGSQVRQLVKL